MSSKQRIGLIGVLGCFADTLIYAGTVGAALLRKDNDVFKFTINNAQKDLRYYTTMTQEQPSAKGRQL